MDFVFTPDEARPTALAVAEYLHHESLKVAVEVPIHEDAPYTTTLLAKAQGSALLVEAVGSAAYSPSLQGLVRWLATRREDSEVYLAVAEVEQIGLGVLRAMKHDGVGLFVVASDGRVETTMGPRNPALMITIDHALPLGRLRTRVRTLETRFNSGDRKGALRDLCELVEGETGTLASRAANHGWLRKSAAQVLTLDWSSQINVLAAANQYTGGRVPLFSQTAKDDLHSFRGARNLVDHPVPTRAAEIRRERQFPERMLMGARLVADLLSLERRVR